MKFSAKKTSSEIKTNTCLVIATTSDHDALTNATKTVLSLRGVDLDFIYGAGDFSGKSGQLLTIPSTSKTVGKTVLLGLGDSAKVDTTSYRKAVKALAASLKKASDKTIGLHIDDVSLSDGDTQHKSRIVAESFVHSRYQFDTTKSSKQKVVKPTVHYFTANTRAANKGLNLGQAIGEGMNIARELGNLPGNICTPRYLTKEAKKFAKAHKTVTAKALSEKQMRELGMGSLLSVSAGSVEEAQLIIMEYKGAPKSVKPHVLVGKGITFDTGGISLKPGAAMDEMKFDMCGAASVFGTMHTIAQLQPKMNVVAIVAAAENMPSGIATKPGDIVTSMSGQTIEVLNTDAEGRLVLCDALTYAERFKPQSVVDIATLTGACVIALGSHATGLYSNDDEMAEALLSAGKTAGDKAWHMPLWDEYQKQLDSNFADIANIGGREAGSVTAACFLSRFTKKYKWAHLDIAGTAWLHGGAKGATGRPVPLLTEYLLGQSA